jgi:putative DNA primase/helicase
MNDPAAQQLRVSDIALGYVRRGWHVVPVPFREKGPRLKGWQNLRIDTAEQIALYFRGPTNIGVILGAASGGLVDIDIDCAEAVEIGGGMLPKTGAVFGRASKPDSHRLYRVTGPAPSMKFDDPVRGDTLIEQRGDKQDGTAGFQTVFPGSIHPSGEPIEWVEDGEPALVEYNEIKDQVIGLATRVLIARHCPGVTTADEARHALAQADPRIMAQIARWHGDVDAARSRNAAQTGQPPLQVPEHEIARVWTALSFVSSSDRTIWLKVGGALFDIPGWPEELRRALWDKWSYDMDEVTSESDKKINEADQNTTWASFARDYPGTRATLGTIYHLAREAGWNGHGLKPLPDELRRFLLDAGSPQRAGDDVQASTQTQAAAADQAAAAPAADPELDAEIKRLAALAPVAYERQRKEAANKLGMRVPVLDKLVNAGRGYHENDEDRQGQALKLVEPEPWPNAVDGFKLVRSLAEAVLRYVVMRDVEDAVTVALWSIHTYVFDLFTCTPRLCISAPEKRCGKTTLLDVIACLVNRPVPTVNITGPAIFRTVEKAKPTLLFDEADNTFNRHGNAADVASDILAILNSGHRHGGQVTRTVGDDFEPRSFSTHAPAAVALIGKLPGTLEDRSVRIRLQRKHSGERVERFRHDRVEELERLARQVRRWCDDNRDRLVASDPQMPEGLFNRVADNWLPLLAIADATGLSSLARSIASQAVAQDTDEGLAVMLLTDIRQVFDEKKTDKLKSEDLATSLNKMDERDWSDYRRGYGVSTRWVAKQLQPFGIRPEPEPLYFRDGTRGRGYLKERFEDVWARYLPPRTVIP